MDASSVGGLSSTPTNSDIEHRTTKIRSPRTNGFVERINRTLIDEHFRIKGREKWYESVDKIQRDLDDFIRFYNLTYTHQGYRPNGWAPRQALRDVIGRKKLPPTIPTGDETAEQKAIIRVIAAPSVG